MAQFVYIDETGSLGTSLTKQPFLTLAAVVVDESHVQELFSSMKKVAWKHLGWYPANFEFHGYDIWHASSWWKDKDPPELIEAYEDVIAILDQLQLKVAYSTIDKKKLHERHEGKVDDNAYRLALQFLLEKIDRNIGGRHKVLVADEAKEEELKAVKMVADMQDWGGGGEVPGRQLATVIDCLHFVRSNASPGVQMADLVAFVLQRARRDRESHPDVLAALHRLRNVVRSRTITWREPWP